MLLQGKAACEITTADELLATEMMFNGTFNSLDKHQLASLVSCLVPVDKSNVSPVLHKPIASIHCVSRGVSRPAFSS